MAKIFINGLNAKTGGGKSILTNYLSLLKDSSSQNCYFVLTPNKQEYLKYENDFIEIVEIPMFFHKNMFFPIVYSIILNRLLKNLEIDVLFNLADIPIRTDIKQVFLFDWAYAVYPESIVWNMMDFKSYAIRKMKLFFFKRYMKYIDTMIAQTDTMKSRLHKLYGFKNIEIIPNAVSLENMSGGEYKNFNLPEGIKLLYLTHYYPHKNIEIFIPLAREIKKRGLNYKLIITIEASQDNGAKKFLEIIERENLQGVIYNIGVVEMSHVPSLYKQCNGLLMPTLLESFSGTYVEAMYHKLPIFTSNIDFARSVCQDGAVYFNPFDENEILSQLVKIFENEQLKKEKINIGLNVLNSMIDWEKAFSKYNQIVKGEIENA
jgi:glycosyltransferase involved in cell wall biosynthesis